MKSAPFLALAAGIAIAGTLPQSARADQLPALPQAASAVDDAALAAVRGKYVPPAQARVAPGSVLAAQGAQRAADPLAYRTAAAASPLSGVTGSGPIVYFGVSMTSTWNVTNNGVTQGVQIGATVNFDLQNRTMNATTWSGSQNGGLPAGTPSGNSVDGAPPTANMTSGVGQSIQVAGNGNVISNQATVAYGTGAYGSPAAPATNDCGAACAFHIGAGGVSISISTAQGVVSQSIGPGGLQQSAQVWSDLNHISNQLGVNVQTSGAHAASFLPNASQIVPVLPVIPGTP